jgi:hypothetical protein
MGRLDRFDETLWTARLETTTSKAASRQRAYGETRA